MVLLGLAGLYSGDILQLGGLVHHGRRRAANRLPAATRSRPELARCLKYFDTHPRGDTLSRVTNDIDNIANTLQQSLTQIITSFATIIGVLAMMFWISPMLAAISL